MAIERTRGNEVVGGCRHSASSLRVGSCTCRRGAADSHVSASRWWVPPSITNPVDRPADDRLAAFWSDRARLRARDARVVVDVRVREDRRAINRSSPRDRRRPNGRRGRSKGPLRLRLRFGFPTRHPGCGSGRPTWCHRPASRDKPGDAGYGSPIAIGSGWHSDAAAEGVPDLDLAGTRCFYWAQEPAEGLCSISRSRSS